MRRHPAFPILVAIAALFICVRPLPGHAGASSPRPRLVVILAVDQMRTEYAEQFIGQWRAGLKRLFEQGAWFTRAAYPYLNTVTCAGHATIGTGAVPAVHGIVLNDWWDRETQRPVHCTDDDAVSIVSYGAPLRGGYSAARLKVPTFADEMRRQATIAPRVVTLSIKPRSAIMLAGHAGDVVLWRQSATWATSTAFTSRPLPVVARWLIANPVERDRIRVWDRALPRSRYLFEDSPVGKKPPEGWDHSLPHALRGDGPSPAAGSFNARWQASPLAEEYLARLAAHLVEQLQLGQRGGTDYLGISFSALDSIGHKFGPESHEVQDALVRLDATIGRLLEVLDRVVGRDRYVLAFSSDHGVSSVPEQMADAGHDAGRIVSLDLARRLEDALRKTLGPERYVARVFYTDVYFRRGVYDRLKAEPAALAAAVEALLGAPGVMRVYRSDLLTGGAYQGDALAAAARLSHYPGRSGDLIIVPKPNWITSNDAATHGTAHPYDARVPVLFLGAGIKGGRYDSDATPADIAPTLARVAGVTLAHATGRVLDNALSSDSPTAGASPRTSSRPPRSRP